MVAKSSKGFLAIKAAVVIHNLNALAYIMGRDMIKHNKLRILKKRVLGLKKDDIRTLLAKSTTNMKCSTAALRKKSVKFAAESVNKVQHFSDR